MSGAGKSSRSTGPMSRSTETSGSAERTTLQPSMFSPEDFPASPSATRGSGKRRTMRGGSGRSSRDAFASYDPDTCSWRTYQASLTGQLQTFSETWPRAGMTRSGTAYRLPPLVLHMSGIASGWLPTLGANEFKGSSRARYRGSPHFRGAKMSEGLRLCESDPIYLHPSFAELVMGYPIGWTDLEDSETP